MITKYKLFENLKSDLFNDLCSAINVNDYIEIANKISNIVNAVNNGEISYPLKNIADVKNKPHRLYISWTINFTDGDYVVYDLPGPGREPRFWTKDFTDSITTGKEIITENEFWIYLKNKLEPYFLFSN